jgi:hypothetical protein
MQMFEEIIFNVVIGAFLVLVFGFLGWMAVAIWREGWRPFGLVLLMVGWERLRFYTAWLRFLWRRDKAP